MFDKFSTLQTMVYVMQHIWRAVCRPVFPAHCLVAARMKAHQAGAAAPHKETVLKSVKEIPGPTTFPLVGCLPSLIAFCISMGEFM